MPMLLLRPLLALGLLPVLLVLFLAPAGAADRDKLEAFLAVTGFDVMLESMALTARHAPGMLGFPDGAFGADWVDVADEVFAPEALHEEALDIFEKTLTDDLLGHAAEFYASPLGLRLVAAENAAHMEDGDEKRSQGEALVAAYVAAGSPRPQFFNDMMAAIGAEDTAVRAVIELQARFFGAASAAGVIDLDVSVDEIRDRLMASEDTIRAEIKLSTLASSAFTYRNISDEDLALYAEALQHPKMQLVYQLMDAIQFELQAARYEILAARMAELHPGQEL